MSNDNETTNKTGLASGPCLDSDNLPIWCDLSGSLKEAEATIRAQQEEIGELRERLPRANPVFLPCGCRVGSGHYAKGCPHRDARDSKPMSTKSTTRHGQALQDFGKRLGKTAVPALGQAGPGEQESDDVDG